MNAFKLTNGNLRVPKRAEGDNDLIGDGTEEVGPEDKLYKAWIEYYEGLGLDTPKLPKERDNGR